MTADSGRISAEMALRKSFSDYVDVLLLLEPREHGIAHEERRHVVPQEAAVGDGRALRVAGAHQHRRRRHIRRVGDLEPDERRDDAGQQHGYDGDAARLDDSDGVFELTHIATGSASLPASAKRPTLR